MKLKIKVDSVSKKSSTKKPQSRTLLAAFLYLVTPNKID